MTVLPPLPRPDADSQPLWDSLRAHQLRLQQCGECGGFRYPPRAVCPFCLSETAEWVPVRGTGRVYVSLVVHRSPSPAWEGGVPFNLSMIQLDEGVRVWSNVVDVDPDAVNIGDPVEIIYDDMSTEVTLPRFRLRLPDELAEAAAAGG